MATPNVVGTCDQCGEWRRILHRAAARDWLCANCLEEFKQINEKANGQSTTERVQETAPKPNRH